MVHAHTAGQVGERTPKLAVGSVADPLRSDPQLSAAGTRHSLGLGNPAGASARSAGARRDQPGPFGLAAADGVAAVAAVVRTASVRRHAGEPSRVPATLAETLATPPFS